MTSRRIHFSILTADLLWIAVALAGSFLLRYRGNFIHVSSHPLQSSFPVILLGSSATWFLLYQMMDLDCFRGGWQMSATVSRTSLAVAIHFAVILACGYFARMYYSRLLLFYFLLLLWPGLLGIRFGAHSLLRAQKRAGKTRKVVLIGDNGLAREMIYRIRRHPELLYEIVGLLSPFGDGETSNGAAPAGSGNGLGSLDVLEILKTLSVREVIVLPKHSPGVELQNFLVRCQQEGILIHLLPQPYELYVSRPRLSEVDGVPLVSLEQPSFSPLADRAKRIFDLVFGILLFLPAMAIVAVAGIALWMKGRRFLRREVRCGREGKPFDMCRLDIEMDEHKASTLDKFFRRLSVSELPQILNVLHGEMSLVGPRPESLERARDYSEWQKQRLKVQPGMTGLAQVNGLREQHSSEEKSRHDLHYIMHWSPVLDLVLLVQTVWTLTARFLHARDHFPLGPAESHLRRRPVAAKSQ